MKHIEAPVDDLRERFILFLASKPADKAYNWHSVNYCACGTFIREHLTTFKRTFMIKFHSVDRLQSDRVWARWNIVAGVKPHTYGALLDRVRAES